MASSINASTAGSGGVITTADNSGVLNIQTAGTTAVTVDTSQNVGIGTSSPGVKLDISGGDFRIQQSAATARQRFIAGSNQWNVETSNSTNGYAIYDAAAGQLRTFIDTSGNFQFNSGYGSAATAYGTRAWVNFNGSTGAIRTSGNVSSITVTGTGNYTVNLTNAMPDTNYAVVGGIAKNGGGVSASNSAWGSLGETKTTSSFLVEIFNLNAAYINVATIQVAVIR
jgi:hypothetical protein